MKEFMNHEARSWVVQVALLIPHEKKLTIIAKEKAFDFSQAVTRLFDDDAEKLCCNINHLSFTLISDGYIDSVWENVGPNTIGDELIQDIVASHLSGSLCNHMHAPHTVLLTYLAVDGIVQNAPVKTHMEFWKVSSASRKKMQEVIDRRKFGRDRIAQIESEISKLEDEKKLLKAGFEVTDEI